MGVGFFILPLLFLSGSSGEPIRVAKEMALIVFGALYLADLVKDRIHPIASGLVLLICYNIIATGFGPAQFTSSLFVLSSLAVSKLVLDLDERKRFFILEVLAYTGLIQALYGFLQMADMDFLFRRIAIREFLYPVGTLGQPTIFGAYLAIASTAALFTKKYWVAAICFVSILCTTSAFSTASALAGLAAYLFMCKRHKTLITLITAGLLLLCGLLLNKDNKTVKDLMYAHHRVDIWSDSINYTLNGCLVTAQKGKEKEGPYDVLCEERPKVRDGHVPVLFRPGSPISGFGIGSFKALYYSIQPEDFRLQSGRFLQAHNDYIQVMFEFGLLGVAFMLLVLGVFARRLLFEYLTHSQRAFGAIGVAILVDSIGSFPLYLMPHGMILCVCLVVVIAHRKMRW